MARYKIQLADSILAAGQANPEMRLVFPEGCALGECAGPGIAGTHWYFFDDPDAPGDLDGREVDLALARVDGKPVITSRRAIAVHAAPGEEDEVFPCCGLPPYELRRGDSLSPDPELVTCAGAA